MSTSIGGMYFSFDLLCSDGHFECMFEYRKLNPLH